MVDEEMSDFMKKRNFINPTAEEINNRKKMYEEAASLGIDLMGFDSVENEDRSAIRKAVLFLGTGREVPEEIKKQLIEKKRCS